MKNPLLTVAACAVVLAACESKKTEETSMPSDMIKLVTVDPGHFHAALVQKTMYDNVDSVVNVYAPEGPDLDLHLKRIEGFNERPDNPTVWQEEVYKGDDFFEKMIDEKKGNVVVLSGNNTKKTEYINRSLEAGMHVLADKPMAINQDDFDLLVSSFETAYQKNLLLYDIMTERYEITSMLQREFSMIPTVFGELEKGTPDNPAVTKESVHHFYKYVSGSILTRPAWFMDVEQQGEGIVDVTTHLVDLIQWACFPEQTISYEHDIQVNDARRWATEMTLPQFSDITRLDEFPDYLQKDVTDGVLHVYSNGEINYQVRGVHAKVSVIWAYQAPEGAGDTHYSIMRGTKANLVIRQGADQKYKPTLYIEPIAPDDSYQAALEEAVTAVSIKFPGVDIRPFEDGFEVIVPEEYHNGHEAHFGQVMEKFLEYVDAGKLPDWEVPNMIAKYYTTITALQLAREKGGQTSAAR